MEGGKIHLSAAYWLLDVEMSKFMKLREVVLVLTECYSEHKAAMEENHQETKTKAFMKVQPPHAHRSSVDMPLDKDVFRDTALESKPKQEVKVKYRYEMTPTSRQIFCPRNTAGTVPADANSSSFS
ncbi:hypothetical protein U0070_012507 [Myodes glareolus]|uniref:Uncharacterized protein n=1 Tax=Myodes glareolus TaxID=447135 RepID=A0AAW0HMN3_MYOGA